MFRVMGLREGIGLFSKTCIYGHPWQPIFLPYGYREEQELVCNRHVVGHKASCFKGYFLMMLPK